MLYFDSCAAAARGDAAGRRRLVEEAVAAYPKDVDALIALYKLPDNTPAQRQEAADRVAQAVEQIDGEIQAVPDETQGYNEFAWLVANTEGDIEKATRYSRLSLDKSPDESSFLDTLAHCHAAAGRLPAAVRTQSLAHRLEPHGRTIQRNLERFRSRLPKP
jgi:tetratricopeptide (TPR) repeat protein